MDWTIHVSEQNPDISTKILVEQEVPGKIEIFLSDSLFAFKLQDGLPQFIFTSYSLHSGEALK